MARWWDPHALLNPRDELRRDASRIRTRDHNHYGPMPRRQPTGGTPWEIGLAGGDLDDEWDEVQQRIYWGGRLERRKRLVDDRLVAAWRWLRRKRR